MTKKEKREEIRRGLGEWKNGNIRKRRGRTGNGRKGALSCFAV